MKNGHESKIDSEKHKELKIMDVKTKNVMIGTVYPNIPLSSASLHSHPQSSLGATLGVCMSMTAYGNLSTMLCMANRCL